MQLGVFPPGGEHTAFHQLKLINTKVIYHNKISLLVCVAVFVRFEFIMFFLMGNFNWG